MNPVCREEWKFDFAVSAPQPIACSLMDHLLLEVCIPWAEARCLGIGGGARPESGHKGAESDRRWLFGFGLATAERGELMSRTEAAELWSVICGWCAGR